MDCKYGSYFKVTFIDAYICIYFFLRNSWFHFLNVLNKVQNNLLCARHWWQDIRHLGPLGYSERCTNMVKTKSGKRMLKKNRDYSFQAFDHFSLALIISNDDFFLVFWYNKLQIKLVCRMSISESLACKSLYLLKQITNSYYIMKNLNSCRE